MLSLSIEAQSTEIASLTEAVRLRDSGHFAEEIALLQRLLQGEAKDLDMQGRGMAWDMLGLAYEDIEDGPSSLHAYKESIRILQALPGCEPLYAAALDNYGSLLLMTGDARSSKRLREQARDLYFRIGDHAGVAHVSGNLARIALSRRDARTMRKQLEIAFREAALARTYTDGDMAVLLADRASLLSMQGDDAGALLELNHAIALWTGVGGPDSFMLGAGYALRAQAYERLGDERNAIADMQRSLAVIAKTAGQNSTRYREMKSIYAGMLRRSGVQEQASLEQNARR